jgi:hypothetical protein
LVSLLLIETPRQNPMLATPIFRTLNIHLVSFCAPHTLRD